VTSKSALRFSFVATLVFVLVEFLGGKLAHSLALIADAAHLLTDAGALGLSLFASWMGSQPATRKMSYGFHRVEILAALVNGVGLVTIAIFLVMEAFHRLSFPPNVQSGLMLGIGGAGLLFNLFVIVFLSPYLRESLNIRSAFYHVVADLLGSFGVIIAGLIIWKTGWNYADPLVSVGVALLIVWGAWEILRNVVEVLLEATPSRVNISQLESRLLSLREVEEICDLHVWTIASGKEALSAHLGVRPGAETSPLLKEVNSILSSEFGIDHSTIQLEEVSQKPHPSHDRNF